MTRSVNSSAEEAFRCGRIAFGRGQKLDRLTGGIEAQILVLAFYPDIGLVNAVALVVGFRCGRQRLFSSGAYACTQRQMQLCIHLDTTFGHQLADVLVRELIPADTNACTKRSPLPGSGAHCAR